MPPDDKELEQRPFDGFDAPVVRGERCWTQSNEPGWCVGNGGFRSAERLFDILPVYAELRAAGLLWGMRSQADMQLLMETLVDRGVAINGRADQLVPKIRAVAAMHGFVKDALDGMVPRDAGTDPSQTRIVSSGGVRGQVEADPGGLTSLGDMAVKASTQTERHEVMLRSAAALLVEFRGCVFSPLRYSLDILDALAAAGEKKRLSSAEITLFVVTNSPATASPAEVASAVAEYRRDSPGNVDGFAKGVLGWMCAVRCGKVKRDTLEAYADVLRRVLLSTGVFVRDGSGVAIPALKSDLARCLVTAGDSSRDSDEYVERLWEGAVLPTDDEEFLRKDNAALRTSIERLGGKPGRPSPTDAKVADLSQERNRLTDENERLRVQEWVDRGIAPDELQAWLLALDNPEHEFVWSGGTAYLENRKLRPAYYEWLVWRVAMQVFRPPGHPHDHCRFPVDHETFLPTRWAPGGGADIVLRFLDYWVALEVTTTEDSSQHTRESASVKRHVGELVRDAAAAGVHAVGAFLAPTLDPNMLENVTGTWHDAAAKKRVPVRVFPVTLDDWWALVGVRLPADAAGNVHPSVSQCFDRCVSDHGSDHDDWVEQNRVRFAVMTGCCERETQLRAVAG